MKQTKALTALEIQRITDAGVYAVGMVAGLYLQVKANGSRSWILRKVVSGKRSEIGLGAYPEISLKAAHTRAREISDQIAKGIDPLAERAKVKAARQAEQDRPDFKTCAERYIKMKSVEWSNTKHIQQWGNTLKDYAYPVIGHLKPVEIEQKHLLQILEPIWSTKTETASRVRGRIELILDWCAAHGMRPQGFNPARLKGQLGVILPSTAKTKTVTHHASMPYADIQPFMLALAQNTATSARCLELAILACTRSNEARSAQWLEFNLEAKLWTIPADRMKAGREHRVPLSIEALALVKSLPKTDSPFLFPNSKGTALSDVAISKMLHSIQAGFTVHGFRSTFRDWAAEKTNYPREVCEGALAHSNTNKVEAAYLRSDLFDKRAHLMQAWATHCTLPVRSANVTNING
jgi:integrase